MAPLDFRTTSLLVFLAVFVIYILCSKYRQHVVANKFKREHGCLPPPRLYQPERIIGVSVFLMFRRAHKANNLLELFQNLFYTNGPTISATLFGKTFITTIDPENIKAILATRFDDFGIGQRKNTFGPLLGNGIFVNGA